MNCQSQYTKKNKGSFCSQKREPGLFSNFKKRGHQTQKPPVVEEFNRRWGQTSQSWGEEWEKLDGVCRVSGPVI